MRRNKAGQIYWEKKRSASTRCTQKYSTSAKIVHIFVRIIKHINETNKFDSNTFKLGHFWVHEFNWSNNRGIQSSYSYSGNWSITFETLVGGGGSESDNTKCWPPEPKDFYNALCCSLCCFYQLVWITFCFYITPRSLTTTWSSHRLGSACGPECF